MTNKILKIINQFLYIQFEVKYLKDLFLMKCLPISPLINSSLEISLVSNLVIPASTNCYQLPTKFLYLLIMDQKLEAFSNKYLKRLVKSGMKGLFSNWKKKGISGELLHILSDFLSNKKQMVVLNGQNSSWNNVHAGVPQWFVLGPLLFLIYINDLSNNLTSNAKLFAYDTSLFSAVHYVSISAKELNNDLEKVNDWAFQWKFTLNPDPSKQSQEVISVANQRDRTTIH